MTLPDGTLGYEWDEDLDNGFRPAGLIDLSLDHGQRAGKSCPTTARVRDRHRDPQPDPLPRTPAARWSSAPARCSGRGGSTATTTAAATPADAACSRRRSTCSPTWACSRRRSRPASSPATQSTDTDTADVDDHLAGGGLAASRAAPPSRSPARPTDMAAARSAASRCRPTAARPGTPRPGARPGATRGSRRSTGSATIKARAPSTTAATSRSPAIRSPSTSPHAPARARSGRLRHSEQPQCQRLESVEVGVKFRADVDGYITGLRFYKGTAQHRHPRRRTCGRPRHAARRRRPSPARPRPAGSRSRCRHPVADHRRTPPTSPPTTRPPATTPSTAATSPSRRRQPAAARARRRRRRRQRRLQLRRRRLSRPAPSTPTNYWVDVVFDHDVGPDTTPPTVIDATPAARRHRRATARRRHRDVQRADRPGDGHRRDRPAARSSEHARRRRPSTYDAPTPTRDARTRRRRSPTRRPTPRRSRAAPAASRIWPATRSRPTSPGRSRPPRRRRRRRRRPGRPDPRRQLDAANPFSRYYAEILRAEGLNEFTATDISTVTAGDAGRLRRRDPRRDAADRRRRSTMFTNWVNGGGNLIAMRPDKQLGGAARPDRRRRRRSSNGYLQVDTGTAPGAGHRRPDDPVPRHRRPLHAQRRTSGRDAVLERRPRRRRTRP